MVYYDEYGKKENPTILMLHGAAATHTFCNQYYLQNRYHLVVPHIYGSGKETDKIYEPKQMIVALIELIRGIGKEKISLMGHSLGGELAVALVSMYPQYFDKAVFLSAWLIPTKHRIDHYRRLAGISCFVFKIEALVRLKAKYWHYTKEQADFLVEYAKKISVEQYKAFFINTLDLNAYPAYANVNIPMLAVCGAREVPEIKNSMVALGKRNPKCKTIQLKKAKHDYPLRMAGVLNPILEAFLQE